MNLYSLNQLDGVSESMKGESENGFRVFRVQRLRGQAEYSPSTQLKDAIKKAPSSLRDQLTSLLVK